MSDKLRAAAQAALEALIWEVGSEPALYAPQTRRAINDLRAALAEPEASATEQVARWMIAHGYATGHGDGIGDLLHHLRCQVRDETIHGRLNRD